MRSAKRILKWETSILVSNRLGRLTAAILLIAGQISRVVPCSNNRKHHGEN